MGLFGSSKKEKQQAAAINLMGRLLAAEAQSKGNTKSSNAGKSKLIKRQCKYCGFVNTNYASNMPFTGPCPKRGKGQPHVWQTLGYQYK